MKSLFWKIEPTLSAVYANWAIASNLPIADLSLKKAFKQSLLNETQLRALLESSQDPPPEITGGFNTWRAKPQQTIADELQLRIGPFRQLWDARAAGLLRLLGLSEVEATILPALPVVGGHGVACPGAKRVIIEAVLANPVAELPELLRLAWLLGQLAGNEASAFVPSVLAAGQELELCVNTPELIEQARLAWRCS